MGAQFGHGCNRWHVRGWAHTGTTLILDPQVIKSSSLVQGVSIGGARSLLHGRCAPGVTILLAFLSSIGICVGVVEPPFALKVVPPSLLLVSQLGVVVVDA